MSRLPSDTVTFLFTDIEGSTKRWEAYPTQMREALSRHDAIVRTSIEQNGGYIFKTVGDAFCAAFSSPTDALRSALDAQRALQCEEWPPEIGRISVRMALHTGAVELQEGDYFGQPVNRVARILSAGHGGQTLLSEAVYALVRDALPAGSSASDLGEHRLKDLTRPEHIFQLQAPDLPSDFPPLKTLDTRSSNLPVQLTAFLGREKEIADGCALLRRPDVHIVTFTGPGGTGKTRLALQVAAELIDDFKDGVYFVALEALTDHRLVVSTAARALGLTEQPGKAIADSLKEYLCDKQMLLVLDNFEQVAQAGPDVDTLLKAAPHLKVLVTSRLALHLYGQKEFPVGPLSLPDMSHGHVATTARSLTQYEAVRLFIERAQDVKPDFQVTNDNAPAVAEICARLDGLPLAIELAAARVRIFSPQALLSRLASTLKMLTGGATNLPLRQQSLRAAIEWSYDLLAEGEKELFRRHALFKAGATLDAIEAVCGTQLPVVSSQLPVDERLAADNWQLTTGNSSLDVLDGVQSLVEENLLQQREGRDGEPRFWMLETIQEYAREKLEESGSHAPARRHALYFMALAEEAAPHLSGPDQQQWLDRLEDEHDNLRAALRWAMESERPEDVEAGLRAASAIFLFWRWRAYYSEGREHLHALLARAAGLPAPGCSKQSRAMALNAESFLARLDAGVSAAQPLAEEALELAREIGDRTIVSDALNILGGIAHDRWDSRAARALYEESLAIRRELGDKARIAASLNNLGNVALMEGDCTTARALYEESLAIRRELGDKAIAAWILFNLGGLVADQGNYEHARSLLEESLAVSKEIGDRENVCSSLWELGNVAICEGDYARARELLEESLAMGKERGLKEDVSAALGTMGNLASAQGDQATAAARYEEASALGREMGQQSAPRFFAGLAANARGEHAKARELMQEMLVQHVEARQGKGIIESLGPLAEALVGMDQVREAALLLGGVGAMLSAPGAAMCTPARIAFERAKALARARLGDEEFERAWRQGEAMSMEETAAYAMQPVGSGR